MYRNSLHFVLGLLLIFISTNLQAQNISDAVRYSISGNGVGARAIGMGGAFTSVADNYAGLFYNPAGIGQVKKIEINANMGFSAVLPNASYQNTTTNGYSSAFSLNNLTGILPIQTSQGSLVFGIGIQQNQDYTNYREVRVSNSQRTIGESFLNSTPNADASGKLILDNYGALAWNNYLQQYDQITKKYIKSVTKDTGNVNIKSSYWETGFLNQVTFGASMEVIRGLFIGISGSYLYGNYTYRNVHEEAGNVTSYQNFRSLILEENISINISGWTAQVGLLWQANTFRFALTAEVPTLLNLTDVSKASLGTTYMQKPSPTATSNTLATELAPLTLKYTFQRPFWAKIGMSNYFEKNLLLSLDIGYRYYPMGKFTYQDNISSDALNQAIQTNLTMLGFDVAIGTEYRFADAPVLIRAGTSYALSPYINNLAGQPSSIYNGKLNISTGFGFIIDKWLAIDVAGKFSWEVIESPLFTGGETVSTNVFGLYVVAGASCRF